MNLHYDWLASLLVLALVIVFTQAGRAIVFRFPALKRTRAFNRQENERKLNTREAIYKPRLMPSQTVGMLTFALGYTLVLPFTVTLYAQPVWRVAVDTVMILMVYDFFYYLTHRFLFHGKGYFLRVHSVHHQARSRVSTVDSFLLHPMETFIGVALYYLSVALLAGLGMGPFGIPSIVLTSLVFVHLNTFNHCRVDLDYFPFRTLNWIAMKHDAHHLDMRRGNYATITLLYDKLFGTLETHPRELAESHQK